ncbi:bifunctional adenosylcobinamide kinase/adenosylcobinamide-phosphate guanylyltransferase [Aquitalea sp. FJL05]|jgi:adenosylcobinamide kinase/adenosylcobinamide-phosphate guanylyltransferase|uniref:bifunctional adenosylcobinamide kinase/adenosylcobinamide-phosphate guanylyltransferase n=1 Tax=Aquitalea sp. FJL05 TaxID=2153366 RepID=UPI000F59D85D|nr:bifunctional adenosylcobinamide kinase/adenosylcobinamide-phosphate guanylyltransferase [Aquitalea sp. FJL05]RQO72777.1 bifunctional adenosylcobinamide kinase/adenosylcobinamide-phosphate guanylyltransferase [Aquitalea sp. FJL05]
MTHLISGGSRSGKSRYAEQLAVQHGGPVTYIATAEVRDDEFAERVRQHRLQRPQHWHVLEAERGLAELLLGHDQEDGLLLVDCLGMWLMRFFRSDDQFDEMDFVQERQWLLEAIAAVQGQLLLVSNEIGWGVMPMSSVARRYGDLLGRLNQDIAARCQRVTLVACGLPLALKGG